MDFCCENMMQHIYLLKERLWHSGDASDKVVYFSSKYEEYGIPIKTDLTPIATSYVMISYCPWCGKKLPESRREEVIARELFETVSANDSAAYCFLKDTSEIESVALVLVESEGNHKQEPQMKTLLSIDDIVCFIQRFRRIPCFLTLEPSNGVKTGDYVFKVCYQNGDYELIEKLGQARFTVSNGFVNDIGKYCFDVDSFSQLIAWCKNGGDAYRRFCYGED